MSSKTRELRKYKFKSKKVMRMCAELPFIVPHKEFAKDMVDKVINRQKLVRL